MSDLLVALGTTQFLNSAESYRRTWYLWGYYDELGELTAIRYGIGYDLLCANPDFHRRECSTPLHHHLWRVAEERLRANLIFDDLDDDFEVLEPFESNVTNLGGAI